MEYDKQGEELDSEKARAINLERQLDDLTRQLQVSSQQVSSVFVSELLGLVLFVWLVMKLCIITKVCYG